MHAILDHLFISSVEAASQVDLLAEAGVRSVVSIGCEINDKSTTVEYLSFPHILDTPETNILNIIGETNPFIQSSILRGESVLVHCVYGQSRSATIIICYLLHIGMRLSEAIDLMKAKNPSTCINPGFLAQLYFLSVSQSNAIERSFFKLVNVEDSRTLSCKKPVEYCVGTKRRLETSLAESTASANDADSSAISPQGDVVICRKCKADLSPCSNNLTVSIDTANFVKAHEDGFWRGYRPNRSKGMNAPVVLPEKGIIATYPPSWMVDQVHQHRDQCGLGDKHVDVAERSPLSGEECELTCPSCTSVVGFWRSRGLNLIGEYNVCDLYAFNCDFARVKKFRHIPNL